MAVGVVVLLEVVDVHHDGTPSIQQAQPLLDFLEKPAVEAAGQGIAQALLVEAGLQELALGDVHQDTVVEHLARLGVLDGVAGVEHRALRAVAAAQDELVLADLALAGQPLGLRSPAVGIGIEILHPEALQLLQRGGAEDLHACRIGIQISPSWLVM